MELQSLKVQARQSDGKGAARRLRREGQVPLVLYGGEKAPVSLTVEERVFERIVHGRGGEHAVVQLEVDGKSELNGPAILKAVQHHPLRGHILHADFMRIRLDVRIQTVVPVHLVGQPIGVQEGGVLDQILREVEVECLALDVPEAITIEVREMKMGDAIHVSDLVVPENVTLITEPDRTVASVAAPRAVKEATAEEAEAAEGAEGEEKGEKAEE